MKEKNRNSNQNLSDKEKAIITRDLFERYRQGKTTQEENEIIENLEINFIPEKDFKVTDMLIDELDKETKAFIFEKTAVKIENLKLTEKKRMLSPVLIGSVAGIALLLIGIFIFYQPPRQNDFFTTDFSHARITQQYLTDNTIEEITLGDGSKVTLNSKTTLSLREGAMDGHSREVWLDEGEAFFDVKSDSLRPFIIHLRDDVTIKVLGTSFTIQSYSELTFQEICVLSGKVKVETSDGKSTELAPDQKAVYRHADKELIGSAADSNQKALWRTGTIVLDNASLDELRFRIHQQYGKNVVFKSNPEAMSINITFNRETNIDAIADEIAALYTLDYRMTTDEIIFSSKDIE